MKNLLKIENILIVGGLAFIGYWIFKKTKPKVIDVSDSKQSTDPKVIYINLNETKGKSPVLDSTVVRQYNSSKFATTSPAMVTINERSNFYDI